MAWKRYRREDNRVEEIWVSLGKEREDCQKITYHSFDVEYDEELQLDTSGGKS